MIIQREAFDKMENELLPVFAEAVNLCKDISNNPNYFQELNNYRAARKLYAMALVSKAIKLANQDITTEEHKKENINLLDLVNERRFYQADGSRGRFENIFRRSELADFQKEMKSLGAAYFDDVAIHECLGSFQYDAAVGMWKENPALISSNGNVLDWKEAKNLGIFKYASSEMKTERFVAMMDKQSKENHWDKKEWDKNYPLVNRECEKYFELKFVQYCKDKQNRSAIKIKHNQHTL